jgi:hypothetical protein
MAELSLSDRALQAVREGRFAEGAALYAEHLAGGRRDPGAAANCAIALRRLRRWEEGLRLLEPYRGETLPAIPYTLGHLYSGLRRWREAVDAFREAARLQTSPDLDLSLARALLALGDYEEGFRLFESRVDVPGFPARRLHAPGVAEWRGEDLTGRSILVWMEQGLGDQIQFARFLPELRGAARIGVACHSAVAPLLATLADEVFARDKPFAARGYHYWTLSMSLPRHFGTRRETVPPAPYLRTPEAYRAKWRGKVPEKVGVVWRANPKNPDGPLRSLPSPDLLDPLREVATVVDLQEPRGDLGDMAAVLEQLDLLVSVDTAPAHLAGALGLPAWVMLADVSDWRWGEGEATPWYPSLRLFRGRWEEMIAKMAAELAERAPTGG